MNESATVKCVRKGNPTNLFIISFRSQDATSPIEQQDERNENHHHHDAIETLGCYSGDLY
jgi:hypothetical protein